MDPHSSRKDSRHRNPVTRDDTLSLEIRPRVESQILIGARVGPS